MGLFVASRHWTLCVTMPKDTSEEDALVTDPSKKTKKAFKKFSYRGVDLEQLLELKTDKLVDLFCARQRRRFRRGLGRKPLALVKKLRKAKRGSRDGQARNDQNALEKHDH